MRKLEDISDKTTPRHTAEERVETARPTGAGPLMNSVAVPVKARWIPCDLGHSTYLNAISFGSVARTVNEKDSEIIEARETMDGLAGPGKVFWKKPEEPHRHIGSIMHRQHRGSPWQEAAEQQNSFGFGFGFSNPVHRISTVHVIRSRDLNCSHVLIIPKREACVQNFSGSCDLQDGKIQRMKEGGITMKRCFGF